MRDISVVRFAIRVTHDSESFVLERRIRGRIRGITIGTGAVANVKGRRWSFLLRACCDLAWAMIDLQAGQYARSCLFASYNGDFSVGIHQVGHRAPNAPEISEEVIKINGGGGRSRS